MLTLRWMTAPGSRVLTCLPLATLVGRMHLNRRSLVVALYCKTLVAYVCCFWFLNYAQIMTPTQQHSFSAYGPHRSIRLAYKLPRS